MKMIEGKAYRLLWLDEDFQLVVIKSNGLLRIYKRYEDEKGNYHDHQWLDDGYSRLKRVFMNDYYSKEKFYYAFLTKEDGSQSLTEIVSKRTVLNEIKYEDCEIIFRETDTYRYGSTVIKDVLIKILIERERTYALYSLKKGYLFGPYQYDSISLFRYGAILDDKIAVENDGYIIDLTEYEADAYNEIYISKKKKHAFILLNNDDCMFELMMEDPNDNNFYIANNEKEIYRYNKSTGKITHEYINNDYHEIDWRQYADIAYEGYSRLELGLED